MEWCGDELGSQFDRDEKRGKESLPFSLFWLGQVSTVWCLDEAMNLQLRFWSLGFPVGVLTQAKACEGRQSEATGHMFLI